MEQPITSGIAFNRDEAKITVLGVLDRPGIAYAILGPVAEANIDVGMRSHSGIASTMFKTLANEGVNLQMIAASEIKISVVIDEKHLELAVRVLYKAFNLEQAA